MPNDELLDSYPKGVYCVVAGSVLSGFTFYGPFSLVRTAVEWAEQRKVLLGNVTIVSIKNHRSIQTDDCDDCEQ